MTPENEAKKLSLVRCSRRTFSKGVIVFVLAAFTGLAEPRKDKMPDDLLSEEELKTAHIKIYQTRHTQLYLQQSALDQFPLFTDAKSGQLKEVVIVLVDHPKIDWIASEKMPEEAKLLWQALPHTKNVISKIQTKVADRQSSPTTEILSKWLERIAGDRYGEIIDPKTISRLAPEFLKTHPEYQHKVFVFLAVGGQSQPKPGESLPDPNLIKESELKEANLGNYRFESDFTSQFRGFVLRHEIGHYEPETGVNLSEYQADTASYNILLAAWQKYQETGDSGGFAFVFVTNEGIIYT